MLVSDLTRTIFLAELQQSPDEAADPEQPPRCPYCSCYLLYLLEHVAAVLLSCFHPLSVVLSAGVTRRGYGKPGIARLAKLFRPCFCFV